LIVVVDGPLDECFECGCGLLLSEVPFIPLNMRMVLYLLISFQIIKKRQLVCIVSFSIITFVIKKPYFVTSIR
jgi:hypothetical protein